MFNWLQDCFDENSLSIDEIDSILLDDDKCLDLFEDFANCEVCIDFVKQELINWKNFNGSTKD